MSLLRLLLSVLLIACASPAVVGASWYVSPTGSDAALGTLERPFATVERAQQAAAPGDSVEIRGGTYRMTESQIASRKGIFARLIVLSKSGLPAKPITYRAYQNEKPVFDCSLVKPEGQRVTAFYVSGSWRT